MGVDYWLIDRRGRRVFDLGKVGGISFDPAPTSEAEVLAVLMEFESNGGLSLETDRPDDHDRRVAAQIWRFAKEAGGFELQHDMAADYPRGECWLLDHPGEAEYEVAGCRYDYHGLCMHPDLPEEP